MRNLRSEEIQSVVTLASLTGFLERKYRLYQCCSADCAANLPYQHELHYIAQAIRMRIQSKLGRPVPQQDLHAMRNGAVLPPTTMIDQDTTITTSLAVRPRII